VASYKVKSRIKGGGKKGGQVIEAGGSIDLTPEEAWDVRYALENPPAQDPSDSSGVPAEVLESVRKNPLHPDSGVELFWKTQPDAFTRTESNKTELERKLEPQRQKAVAQAKGADTKKTQAKVAGPVVPPTTRPSPKDAKK
jgi:hypothetical protein